MITDIIRLTLVVFTAILAGKLMMKIKMPAILGWLITGMIMGPHAVGLLSQSILDQQWYKVTLNIFECSMGLMIGTELVWNKIKKLGKQIFIITLTQSLGTFFVVSAVFALIFWYMNIPITLGLIFGGIALATAPAPALSIVNEYKTDGPVTKTLIPMAALDDIIAIIVFLSVMAFTFKETASVDLPSYIIFLIVLIPVGIGITVGFTTGMMLKKKNPRNITLLIIGISILVASSITLFMNYKVMPAPILNFMLVGMAFSGTFSNIVSEERLQEIMDNVKPILGFCFVVMILNLGAPLDYHLILGAGVYTAVYILSRAAGKIGGSAFGAHIVNAPTTVKKYLGFTLLPHSGVSLVLTGIAVSSLKSTSPDSAVIVQGTIAAAAVINEVFAVILSKQAFKKAGEFNK
ncbi:cation:proton antiporter [Abyssisolibacter fermentans]|uniref:cation:proton antiporter n=1 Tax=Abyssisolibacter fermentans TaxID=1766203 RepID=UPI0012E34C9F|nr:cation:proton antiporter [Abyssisolibacter fermentans]